MFPRDQGLKVKPQAIFANERCNLFEYIYGIHRASNTYGKLALIYPPIHCHHLPFWSSLRVAVSRYKATRLQTNTGICTTLFFQHITIQWQIYSIPLTYPSIVLRSHWSPAIRGDTCSRWNTSMCYLQGSVCRRHRMLTVRTVTYERLLLGPLGNATLYSSYSSIRLHTGIVR